MSESTALLTDRYELTMVDAALRDGTAERRSVFEVFARSLPGGRRYGVVAGTGRLLELIAEYRFDDAQLDWLRGEAFLSAETLDWLANYRFGGDIWGYREGEIYFPGSPILTVSATFAEAVLLETVILSALNYDSAVATAAARMVSVAGGRPLAEMGSRRTNERSAVAAARAAYIAGFSATSNLAAGHLWRVPTMGTAAHAFTLVHDSELDAFRAQVVALGNKTTLLVDSYDIERGVENAVAVAGRDLGAVRIDSGELPAVVQRVREQLDALGARGTKITVTSDLDEYTIARLQAAPVDSYGVGTSVATGSGHPAMGFVYKLVARHGGSEHPAEATAHARYEAVAKTSKRKESVGGVKWSERRFDELGVAEAEVVHVGASLPDVDGAPGGGSPKPGDGARPLTTRLMSGGRAVPEFVGSEGVTRAREHHSKAVAELPAEAFRLSEGEPGIPTVYARADS